MAAAAFSSFEGVYTDVAVIKSAIERLHNELQKCQQTLRRTQAGYNELQGELEMLVDSIVGRLVKFGGYSHFHQMNLGQRQRMYAMERANLVASRAMGMQRYVQSIREANRGVVHGGQDTDVGMMEEGGESKGEPTNDPEICLAPEQSNYSQVLETFRNELTDSLRRESWSDAWQFQNGLMPMLDAINLHQPVPPEIHRELFTNLSNLLRQMSEQQTVRTPVIAAGYQQYSNQLREMSL
eukprot:s673_g20.t1